MKPLKAFHVTALTVFHGWQFFQIIPGTPARTLLIEKRPDYQAVKPYLMPGQPQLREIAQHHKSERLMYEHFSRDYIQGHEFENMKPGKRQRDVLTRDQVKRRIVPVEKAAEVKVNEISGPVERLVFEDIKNAPPSAAPRSVPSRR